MNPDATREFQQLSEAYRALMSDGILVTHSVMIIIRAFSFTHFIIQGGAKNGATGHPISLQIFRKLHDRIAWKLVDFCNIIC